MTAWFVEHAAAVTPPLHFELITGGHSNLTFSVRDADQRHWVLRRPPLGQVLATAHDMGREHRIIRALAPTDVPVAPTVGLCTDDSVNGAPFYVMDFVDGTVVRDVSVAEQLSPAVRRSASESVIDVLARIHAVDLAGQRPRRPRSPRGLHRAPAQALVQPVREVQDPRGPRARRVYSGPQLARSRCRPAATIVHGDYRLDNCMIGDDGQVMAVLDWELCTLGDPLADLGLLMVYWTDPDDVHPAGISGATVLDGFLRRDDLLARYAEASGRDLSAIDYYVAFGYWKLACIIEGVYARYKGGAMGHRGDDGAFDFFGEQVIALTESARQAIGRLE